MGESGMREIPRVSLSEVEGGRETPQVPVNKTPQVPASESESRNGSGRRETQVPVSGTQVPVSESESGNGSGRRETPPVPVSGTQVPAREGKRGKDLP